MIDKDVPIAIKLLRFAFAVLKYVSALESLRSYCLNIVRLFIYFCATLCIIVFRLYIFGIILIRFIEYVLIGLQSCHWY